MSLEQNVDRSIVDQDENVSFNCIATIKLNNQIIEEKCNETLSSLHDIIINSTVNFRSTIESMISQNKSVDLLSLQHARIRAIFDSAYNAAKAEMLKSVQKGDKPTAEEEELVDSRLKPYVDSFLTKLDSNQADIDEKSEDMLKIDGRDLISQIWAFYTKQAIPGVTEQEHRSFASIIAYGLGYQGMRKDRAVSVETLKAISKILNNFINAARSIQIKKMENKASKSTEKNTRESVKKG